MARWIEFWHSFDSAFLARLGGMFDPKDLNASDLREPLPQKQAVQIDNDRIRGNY